MLHGDLMIAVLSPVFKENIYVGIFDDIEADVIPKEIDFFNIQAAFEQYPLTKIADEHIQFTILQKGDCAYIPSLYWMQSKITSDHAMFLNFYYEESSKYASLLFEGIRQNVHIDD